LGLKQEIKSHIRDVKDFPKKGIVFKDITPVLKNPLLCSNIVKELSRYLSPETTHVVGVESRGFLFGLPLTIENNLSFVLIRKKGKLPYKTISTNYDLEYGKATIEMNIDDVGPGDRVVIHDDLLAIKYLKTSYSVYVKVVSISTARAILGSLFHLPIQLCS
jgi:adenine phosphoribosyltransferase